MRFQPRFMPTRDDVAGIIAAGGSGNTALVAPGMRALIEMKWRRRNARQARIVKRAENAHLALRMYVGPGGAKVERTRISAACLPETSCETIGRQSRSP